MESEFYERKSPTLNFISAGSLIGEKRPEVKWLVEGLLITGGLSLLAGKPKSGKSSLARVLAKCVSRGDKFLGRKVIPGAVLYIALEDVRHQLAEYFEQLEITEADQIQVFCESLPGQAVQKLRTAALLRKPRLIVIDTLFRFIECYDSNSYTEVVRTINPLLQLARESGAHIVLVHHMGKAERNDSADMVLGSVGIHGSVDCTLMMKRQGERRTIQSQQRYGTDLSEMEVEFDLTTGMITLGRETAQISLERAKTAILDCLAYQDEPTSEAEIDKMVSGSTHSKRVGLRELISCGQIVRTGKGGKQSPFRYELKSPL